MFFDVGLSEHQFIIIIIIELIKMITTGLPIKYFEKRISIPVLLT